MVPFLVDQRKTVSHTYNDVIEYVLITLLSSDSKDRLYDIAFRGNFIKEEFILPEKSKLSQQEQNQVTKSIQNYVLQSNIIPPCPMSADTLLLKNMDKLRDNLIIAKYNSLRFGDLDGDYGNEALFILLNDKVIDWFAGMGYTYNYFELKGDKYLLLGGNS